MVSRKKHARRCLETAVVLLAAALLSGCAALDTGAGTSLPVPVASDGTQAPSITMEIREAGERPRIEQIVLDGDTTVQQSLEKANLVKKFRRMDIHIVRVVGDHRAKMDVKYEHARAQVDPLYDYALYPNDHVIVQQVTKTALDDMLESLGPLGPLTGAAASRPERRYRTL
jgi:hypothetical protein